MRCRIYKGARIMNYTEAYKPEIRELFPYNAFIDVELRTITKSGIQIYFILSRMDVNPYGKRDKKNMKE